MSNVLSEEKQTTSHRAGAAGLAAAAHREGNRRSPGNGRGISEGGRNRGPAARRLGPAIAGKTGQRGVHRLWRPAKPAIEVTTDSAPTPSRPQPTASACEPYRDFIEAVAREGRNAMAIWQDLVDGHGFAGALRQRQALRPQAARVRVRRKPAWSSRPRPAKRPRSITAPVRWCAIRDTGKYRRTRLFVLTLGYSRKVGSAAGLPIQHAHLGRTAREGVPPAGRCAADVVLDNLREGVLTPDIYDPTLNPLYRDVLAHYGAVALPCRVRDPDRKGKVESRRRPCQKTPLKGLRFESLEEAQTYLDHWEERWADTRIHGTTKRQVAAMFAEEKPALLPLPLEPFRYYQYGERRVHLDGCVEVEAAYYSAPPGWIGRRVQVQWDGCIVRVLDPRTGQLLREHLRQQRGRHRIQDEDQPSARLRSARSNCWPRCRASRTAHRRALPADARPRRTRSRPPHPGRAVSGEEVRRAARR